MILDIILAVVLLFAVIKGFQRGLIVAVFSIVAFVIGLAAAMKLSTVVAGYIGKAVKISDQWLPFVSFIVVFIVVILLVRWGANLIQKGVEFAMLGWVNRLGGILLYVCLYLIVFSVVVFYAQHLQLIRPETIKDSVSYPYIEPLGPKVIDGIGRIIPFFKNMFTDLQDFFGSLSHQISMTN